MTSEVVIRIFKKRAKFRFRIVVRVRPQPIFSYGWLKANSPIPRNRNTIYSAVAATVS